MCSYKTIYLNTIDYSIQTGGQNTICYMPSLLHIQWLVYVTCVLFGMHVLGGHTYLQCRVNAVIYFWCVRTWRSGRSAWRSEEWEECMEEWEEWEE